MKKGDMVLVHLSDEKKKSLRCDGNNTNPIPGIIVEVWENEYPNHPVNTTGLNVRVFTDGVDVPIWLTSLPMKCDGVEDLLRSDVSTYELITSKEGRRPGVGSNVFYYPKDDEVEKYGGYSVLPAVCLCTGDMAPELSISTGSNDLPVVVKKTVYHVDDWQSGIKWSDPNWAYTAKGYWSWVNTETKD